MKTLDVYNLEFPIGITELKICGYVFTAVQDYSRVLALMPNYSVTNITGSHQVTATVTTPDNEENSLLPFQTTRSKLYDVLLFLTIFSGRNVFVKDWNADLPITADYRMHTFAGADLRLSIDLDHKVRVKGTGEIIDSVSANGIPFWDIEWVSLGFDTAIENVINYISRKEWSDIYDDGYFLFTYQSMVRWQNIEPAFLMAWTLWESLFSVENRNTMQEQDIYNTSGYIKISYILKKYFSITVDASNSEQVKLLVKARNRIAHFGKMHPEVSIEDMKTFIQVTDQIVAEILGLTPKSILGSLGKFKTFLGM